MKKIKLSENMKSSFMNKKGICSMHMVILLMGVMLLSGFILDATNITLKSISKRESIIQEGLWGESIFQAIDVYLMESLAEEYNNPPKELFTGADDNSEIKIKILKQSFIDIWGKDIKVIGGKLLNATMLESLGMQYKSIDRTAYTYDDSAGVKYFKLNKDMTIKNITSSEDFALKISVTVAKGEDRFTYSKDYFFKIPLYSEELVNKMKAYYKDESNSKPWINQLKFDIKDNLITSEVYYEKS